MSKSDFINLRDALQKELKNAYHKPNVVDLLNSMESLYKQALETITEHEKTITKLTNEITDKNQLINDKQELIHDKDKRIKKLEK